LARRVDTVCRPRRNAIEWRSAGAVDPRQSEYPRAERQPSRIGLGARAPTPAANRRALIDPGAAGIAIDAGRGEIAQPLTRQQVAIARQYRIAIVAGRYRRQYMAGAFQRGE